MLFSTDYLKPCVFEMLETTTRHLSLNSTLSGVVCKLMQQVVTKDPRSIAYPDFTGFSVFLTGYCLKHFGYVDSYLHAGVLKNTLAHVINKSAEYDNVLIVGTTHAKETLHELEEFVHLQLNKFENEPEQLHNKLYETSATLCAQLHVLQGSFSEMLNAVCEMARTAKSAYALMDALETASVSPLWVAAKMQLVKMCVSYNAEEWRASEMVDTILYIVASNAICVRQPPDFEVEESSELELGLGLELETSTRERTDAAELNSRKRSRGVENNGDFHNKKKK